MLLHSSAGMATPGAHSHSARRASVNTARERATSRTETRGAGVAATIEGAASTYDPAKPGKQEGGKETASGERYDPNAWTAAIQTGLRRRFGGIRFGKDYRRAYALVESADKSAIVEINDVGPLRPGRIIDLNTHAMRYFDPTQELGVIPHIKVTPLPGSDWTTGPAEGVLASRYGVRQAGTT